VFCASLADVFDNEVDPAWRGDLFALIRDTPNLDWLLLTKRIGNVEAMAREAMLYSLQMTADQKLQLPANVWLGATICNRDEMLRDGPKLMAIDARVRFWSYEPALGPLGDIPNAILPDWIIAGGESGPRARPAHPDWFRALRDKCDDGCVAFLFKQWGEWAPAVDAPHEMQRFGKAAAGRRLDGKILDGYPVGG
jgi:protein gp37